MLTDSRLDAGWRTALPLLLTLATVIPVLAATGEPATYAVLAAGVSLTIARHSARSSSPAVHLSRLRTFADALGDRLVRLPVAVVLLALLGVLLRDAVVAADAVIVAAVLGALLARRAGPRGRAAGRAVLMPLFAMFVTPVPHDGGPVRTTVGVLLVSLLALVWSAVVAAGLPGRRPSVAPLRRARRPAALHRVARELDRVLPPDAIAARAALLRVQVAADSGGGTSAALDDLEGELRRLPAADGVLDPAEADGSDDAAAPADPARAARRAAVLTSLAVQSAVAVALGLGAGQLLFPDHWTWTALTALTLTAGARSRGDVVLRGLQRLGGALAGTVVATGLAVLVADRPALAVAVLVLALTAGAVLRELDYAWWAFCLSVVIVLLHDVAGVSSGAAGSGDVLAERLLAILVGALCALGPALLLRPVPTALPVRRQAADWLAASRSLLAAADAAPSRAALDAARAMDDAAGGIRDVGRSLHVAARLPGRATPEPVAWARSAASGTAAARRVALGDAEAVAEVKQAYAAIGRSLRRPG